MLGRTKSVGCDCCEQAAVEQDQEKLMALVTEINALLDANKKDWMR